MRIIKVPLTLQQERASIQKETSIGFVPTMGGLHQGHLSLIKQAKKENDLCIVSIFLNPTQFNNSEDLSTYPSSLDDDIELLTAQGVDILFTPSFENIYPDKYKYEITEKDLSHDLCGADRPGHFNGVLTIVLKLLNITQPSRAYFGEKDYQQLSLIRGMVEAFFIPTKIISTPIVRDDKGLALSSRNKRLSEQGVKKAQYFASQLQSKMNIKEITENLKNKDIKIDYLKDQNGRRFGAVQIEDVRLIDNVQI